MFEQEAAGSVVQSFLSHSIAGAEADDDEFEFDVAAAPVQKGLAQSAQQRAQERKKLERQQVCEFSLNDSMLEATCANDVLTGRRNSAPITSIEAGSRPLEWCDGATAEGCR